MGRINGFGMAMIVGWDGTKWAHLTADWLFNPGIAHAGFINPAYGLHLHGRLVKTSRHVPA
jgi:hypothetical protein